MSTEASKEENITALTALTGALKDAAAHNAQDTAPPAAVLWPDPGRRWEAAVPRLRAELALLTLGDYAPESLTGPAIWLRCALADSPEAARPDSVPVIYLPGESRTDLRAVEDCPRRLQPLAELQYRGVLFTHRNGRDWTPEAFLQNRLGVKVGEDASTREALARALPRVLDEPVSSLQAHAPLRAAHLNELLAPDPEREILLWLNEPDGYRSRYESGEESAWEAFRAVCRSQYGFDPVGDGELTAARLLGEAQGPWKAVWDRFAEAPGRYRSLPELLERARPPKDTLFEPPAPYWPRDNREEEERLREALLRLPDTSDPASDLLALEAEHGERRGWVWAELGYSPLAKALLPLAELARAVCTPPGAGTPGDLAERYADGGWKADRAALESLSAVETESEIAGVRAAVDALYRPWLDETSRRFQEAVARIPLPSPAENPAIAEQEERVCILFTDGLRYDVARYLVEVLEGREAEVQSDWRFSAMPGVTGTAKPAISPVAPLLKPGDGFDARANGTVVKADSLRRLLREEGYQVLSKDEVGDPRGRAWTEFGDLDSIGHAREWKLAREVWRSVRELADRVEALLKAGWREVRVVTDHGWLLLPGGLPKVDLPEHLTVIRKGRCARVKDGASVEQQTVAWSLDPQVSVAVAPGVGCYVTGKEYEHGGLSLQECVVPVLTVRAGHEAGLTARVTITDVSWSGLRCKLTAEGDVEGADADLRSRAADPDSSLVRSKPLKVDGTASLFVEDDRREGDATIAVVVDDDGRVLAQSNTRVGG